jgi:DNA-binding MarR family transcriptional regulator
MSHHAARRTQVHVARPEEAWRANNIGRLLNNAIIRFESRVLQYLQEEGHGRCTLSHINLTRNLDIGGTRPTELARRANMTKQSMGQLITQLEALGLIERTPDAEDGRAVVVRFTEAGLAWMQAFHAALEQAEREMEAELGMEVYAAIKSGLGAYVSRD